MVQGNVIVANRNFQKFIFKSKTVILKSYIKEDLAQDNFYRRTRLVARSANTIWLVSHSTHLTIFSTVSTCLPTQVLAYPFVEIFCPHIVPICPFVVLMLQLVISVLVALPIGLFDDCIFESKLKIVLKWNFMRQRAEKNKYPYSKLI